MLQFERPWRHVTKREVVPSYLRPVRSRGLVRFDPTVRTAGEIVQSRLEERNGASERLEAVMPRNDRNRPAA